MRTTCVILATWLALTCMLAPRATLAQGEFQSGHFQTSDGVKLHYLEAGTGPTLVFVPGWTMPAEIWEHQLRHFASTHRTIALDPRGQGRSEKPAYGYQPSRRALDIGELLEHLGGEPAVVVGWSLAVQEVLVYTHESGTNAVRAAVLVDCEIDWDPEGLKSRFISLQVDRPDWTRGFIEAIHRAPQSEEYFETLTQAALSTPTNAAAIMIANLILMGPTDLRPALASLDRPVLLIFSSLDWAVAEAEIVREQWPELRVEIIENTSHALFVDEPQQFNRMLEEFIAALPEATTNLARAEVLQIAEATARSEGYDVSKYNMTACHYEFTRKDHTWTVFYELKPPAPPGGHFMVSIDDQTKKASLAHGE